MNPLRKLMRRLQARVLLGQETQQLMLGRLMAEQLRSRGPVKSLHDVEFRVFSQFGDDGIIQWLTQVLEFPSKVFIEFGVEDYQESNTRFLMMNNNWSGLVMDGSAANVAAIVDAYYYWRHELTATQAFIDRDNIESLIAAAELPGEPGILHIDIDGNDYWVWEAIRSVRPVLAIIEYNWIFGPERPLSVPYDPAFVRNRAHSSNLYFGCSLAALIHLSSVKGYTFIGTNSAGNNAYFVRNDACCAALPRPTLAQAYVAGRFRDARAPDGSLTYLSRQRATDLIRGLPVWNVVSNELETF